MEDDEPPGSTTVAEPLAEVHAAPKLARISSMIQASPHDPAEDFGHIDTGNETAIFAPIEDTVEQSVVEPALPAPPRAPTPMMLEADLPVLLPRAYGPLPRADWAVELPAAPPARRSWMPYIVVAVAVLIAMAALFLIARSATLPPAPPLQ